MVRYPTCVNPLKTVKKIYTYPPHSTKKIYKLPANCYHTATRLNLMVATMKCLVILFSALSLPLARAEGDLRILPPDQIPVGNTLIRQDSIETVVKGIVARIINADVNGATITFGADGMREVIPIEPKDDTFREVLRLLGIRDKIAYSISPLKIRF